MVEIVSPEGSDCRRHDQVLLGRQTGTHAKQINLRRVFETILLTRDFSLYALQKTTSRSRRLQRQQFDAFTNLHYLKFLARTQVHLLPNGPRNDQLIFRRKSCNFHIARVSFHGIDRNTVGL